MVRLRKVDVERLLAGYDDEPVVALCEALVIVTGTRGATWEQLLEALPIDAVRREALGRCDQAALDELVAELNELRTVDGM